MHLFFFQSSHIYQNTASLYVLRIVFVRSLVECVYFQGMNIKTCIRRWTTLHTQVQCLVYMCRRRRCILMFVGLYSTWRFSQLLDFVMSLRQIFCKISLAKWSDMCVRELRIFMAFWAAAFLSRVSFRRICVMQTKWI